MSFMRTGRPRRFQVVREARARYRLEMLVELDNLGPTPLTLALDLTRAELEALREAVSHAIDQDRAFEAGSGG